MSQDKYCRLILSYGALTGLEKPGRVIDGSPICVNKIPFSLIYDHKTDSDNLFIYGDLGALSESDKREFQRVLLSANLSFYADYGACLALSPTSEHATFCLSIPLDALTPEGLHERLRAAACVAQAWREQFHSAGEQASATRV